MTLNTSPIFKKGEMFIDRIGWPGIVTQGTRGKNPKIINCVEIWGDFHEQGSKYVNEILYRINKEEFYKYMIEKKHNPEERYFKGELI